MSEKTTEMMWEVMLRETEGWVDMVNDHSSLDKIIEEVEGLPELADGKSPKIDITPVLKYETLNRISMEMRFDGLSFKASSDFPGDGRILDAVRHTVGENVAHWMLSKSMEPGKLLREAGDKDETGLARMIISRWRKLSDREKMKARLYDILDEFREKVLTKLDMDASSIPVWDWPPQLLFRDGDIFLEMLRGKELKSSIKVGRVGDDVEDLARRIAGFTIRSLMDHSSDERNLTLYKQTRALRESEILRDESRSGNNPIKKRL